MRQLGEVEIVLISIELLNCVDYGDISPESTTLLYLEPAIQPHIFSISVFVFLANRQAHFLLLIIKTTSHSFPFTSTKWPPKKSTKKRSYPQVQQV